MSDLYLYAATALAALCACLFSYLCVIFVLSYRRKMSENDDDWRDKPPLILSIFRPMVRYFSADVRRKMSPIMYEKMQIRLSSAGMSYAILPEEFLILRFVCLLLTSTFAAIAFWSFSPMRAELNLLAVASVPLGFLYPDIWLRDRIKERRFRVAKEFPFLLDVLVLSMRAGLNYAISLGQAVNRLPNGPTKEEFQKLLREVRAGKSRREALLDLGRRMDIESVHAFVAAVNQADETGAEIGDVLSAQAMQRRQERFNAAEAQANKAPVKMLVPLMLFLFPIIFLLVAFILIVEAFHQGTLPPGMAELLR